LLFDWTIGPPVTMSVLLLSDQTKAANHLLFEIQHLGTRRYPG